MQLVLSTRYTRQKLGSKWWLQFYSARYLRLLPIYLIASLLVVGACLLKLIDAPLWVWNFLSTLPNTPENLLALTFLVLTNLTMFFQDIVMFLAIHSGHIVWSGDFGNSEVALWQGLAIPHAWSLGIELSFYFIAPYLLNLRSRWLILCACIGLAVKVIAIESLHLGDPWTYRFFPFELAYFFLGAVVFRFRSLLEIPKLNNNIGRFFAYLLTIGLTAFNVPHAGIATSFYPIAFACILPFVFKMTATLKVDRLIGELSYPFYLFHLFGLMLAASIVQNWLHSSDDSIAWVALGLALALSVIGLAFEIRFIEPWRVQFAERQSVGHSRSAGHSIAKLGQSPAEI